MLLISVYSFIIVFSFFLSFSLLFLFFLDEVDMGTLTTLHDHCIAWRRSICRIYTFAWAGERKGGRGRSVKQGGCSESVDWEESRR